MPVSTPKTGESKNDFIARCMSDPVMQEYDQEKRAGICYTQWEQANMASKNATAAWDFSAAKYDLDQLIRACAWVADKSKDELAKGDCKLPHHTPDGTLIWRGVAAAGAAIQGARGGVSIPSGDLAKVRSHLAAHYHEFDRKAPWEAAEHEGLEDYFEIFRAGEYPQGTITGEDLDIAVSDYNPDIHEAPVVVGHPEHNKPAFGWVESLKHEGGVLLAKLRDVVPEFAETVKQGLFKKRSASFLRPHVSPTGRWYLNHIGFLGGAIPQVKGLKDIGFADARHRADFEFTKEESMPEPKVLTQEQVQKMIDEAVAKAKADAKAEFTAQAAIQKTENEALQAKVKAAEDKTRKVESEAARKDVVLFLEDLVKQGKMLPAMKDSGLVEFMMGLDGETATVEFVQGDKKEKIAPRAWIRKWMEGLPKVVNFERVTPGDKGSPTDFEKLVEKYQTEKKISRAAAISFTAKEHPEAHAEYLQDLKASKK